MDSQEGTLNIYDGEGAFLPSQFIHRFDLTVGSILLIFLLANAIHMWYLVMVKGTTFRCSMVAIYKEIIPASMAFFHPETLFGV